MEEFLKRLAAIIGLPETATEDDLAERIATLAEAKADAAHFIPLGDVEKMVRDFNDRDSVTSEIQAVAMVDAAVKSGKLPPALRDWGLALCRSDMDAFKAFVEKTTPVVMAGSILDGRPTPSSGPSLDDEAMNICAQLGIAPDGLRKTMAAR